jgi:hypothetical protein
MVNPDIQRVGIIALCEKVVPNSISESGDEK